MADPPHRSLSIPEPAVRVLNADSDKANGQTSQSVSNEIEKTQTSAIEIAKQLQKLMLRLKGEAMTEDGKGVDYEKLKMSKLFGQFEAIARSLRTIDLHSLTDPDVCKAFFINIYNALTIHGLVDCSSLPASVLNIQLFWRKTSYNIGGYVMSLDDIEHGILRGNRPHPGGGLAPFQKDDPRLKLVLKNFDPRVHFALVCGAKGCPAIQIYGPENLNKALDAATRVFCDENIRIHPVQKEIFISEFFQWYRRDFGVDDLDALRWTMPYLSEKKSRDLSIMLTVLDTQGMVDITYVPYNWNLNKMT